MASKLLVKRSTGTAAPGTVDFGELALTVGAGTQANLGDRLFVGDNNSAAQGVGGKPTNVKTFTKKKKRR